MFTDNFLTKSIFKLGGAEFSIQKLAILLIVFLLYLFLLKMFHTFSTRQIAKRLPGRADSVKTISNFLYYFALFVGFVIILQVNGIDLTALTLLTSALGIGIGFGLQAITNNLISGIIILFERPIKIGDRIDVGDVSGDIVAISLRATTIITNDNVSIIIPNSEFITNRVTNWTHNNKDVRFNISVGVSYSSDPNLVKKLLLEVAENHSGVLKEPKSDVLFDNFGDSSINFILRVWTRDYSSRPGVLRSELNFKIFEIFKQNNIEIPFPQLEVRMKK